MKIIKDTDDAALAGPSVAAIGFFDGLHRGHAYLLSRVVEAARERGLASAVVTFPQHPLSVVRPDRAPQLISTFAEKTALIEGQGIDYCFAIDFTPRTASLSALEFMRDILKAKFNIHTLVVGYDNRFGHNREEGFEDYCRYGREIGMEVVAADKFAPEKGKVSSSAVRRALASGNVACAANLLGREYSLQGVVTGGYRNGRKLGFATANIGGIDPCKIIPAKGVYAVRVATAGETYCGMLNIGERPTISWDGKVSVEVNIFDFDKDIYGMPIEVSFVERIRDEQKFSSAEELVEQLHRDRTTAMTLLYVEKHRGEDPRKLALQASGRQDIDHTAAMTQISGYRIAAKKIPSWAEARGIVYPVHLSMEQCSSEETARIKATIAGSGESMADLTGGFGVDFFFMSRGFGQATYVEADSRLCDIARHNMSALGAVNATVVNGMATDVLAQMPHTDLIYIDPARRDSHGQKTVSVKDCTPDLTECSSLLLQKAGRLMMKLSPMLDINAALRDLPFVTDVYIISVRNECKELLLVKENVSRGRMFHCINAGVEGTSCLSFGEEEASLMAPVAEEPMQYLYEPDTSVMKAGAWGVLAHRFGTPRLAHNTNLFTSHEPVEDFPGRKFRIEAIHSFDKKSLRQLVSRVTKANITVRNFPAAADELRKRLKMAEGGDTYLFATTLADGRRVIVECIKYKKS